MHISNSDLADAAKAEIERLSRELDEARAALKPFAEMAGCIPEDCLVARVRISDEADYKIMGSDLHQARASLSKKDEDNGNG
jgi:hypothetical protein